MEYLGIRLGASLADSIQWLVYSDTEKEVIASGELNDATTLASLADKAQNPRIIAIAPSSEIGFKTLELPAKSSRKVLQAVPFMLEEELAEDISDLFFAFGGKSGTQQEVAYCRRACMQMWQDALTDAGLFCDTLVPDSLCLPITEGQVSAIEVSDSLILRTGSFSGMQGEASWISELLNDALQEEDKSLAVFSELSQALSPNITEDKVHEHYELLPMLQLLQGAIDCKLNLFQSEFVVKRQTTGHWHKWRWAASIAALALLVSLIDTKIQTSNIAEQRSDVREQIKQATKRGFPNLDRVLNHRRTLQREIQKLEQGGSGLGLLTMLEQLSPVFSNSGVVPQSIRFDAKRTELRMQSVARNFESLEQFSRSAKQLGYAVEQGAINNKGDQVTGAIVIKG